MAAPTVHFQDIASQLCRYLIQAQYSIHVAVCWFSQRDIFEMLLNRLRAGVRIEVLLEYDTQNIRPEGLNFQAFIQKGGQLFACRASGLMHHKFAIVDSKILLTGSFNWTNNSNAENLLALRDAALITTFQDEFERLKTGAQRITRVSRADAKVFAAFPLFENTRFPLSDLRKKVSGGAGVWLVRVDQRHMEQSAIFKQHFLPFDAAGLLISYWLSYRIWDEPSFETLLENIKPEYSPAKIRALQIWTRRMRIGDVVLATTKKQQVIGVGILQSDPQPYSGEMFSSFRAVQWLKVMADAPYLLPEKNSGMSVLRYRGSALRLLQEVFDEAGRSISKTRSEHVPP